MRNLMRFLSSGATLAAALSLGSVAAAGPLDAPGATKALVCSACHGLGGASQADVMPILAGMEAAYFKKTVFDYASGRRPSAEMEPFAHMTLELGVDDVAAYFAAQPFQPTAGKADPAAVRRGQSAAGPCAVCHGPEGRGDAAKVVPRLAGQPAGYLLSQMALFKQEARSPGDDPLKAMKTLMRTIPDGTLADLAAYYSSLR